MMCFTAKASPWMLKMAHAHGEAVRHGACSTWPLYWLLKGLGMALHRQVAFTYLHGLGSAQAPIQRASTVYGMNSVPTP